jgi:transposase
MSTHRIDLPGKGGGPRRFSAAVKEEIVLSTLEAGATVASVARRYDLDPSQIYQWRKTLKVSRLPSGSAQELAPAAFIPVTLSPSEVGGGAVALLEGGEASSGTGVGGVSRSGRRPGSDLVTGVIEIRIGRQHRVRVGDDFATETLDRVLSVLRRHA